MSDPHQRAPSVSSLASVLVRRDPVAAAPSHRVAIARPSPLVRTLLAAVLLMMLGLTGGLIALYAGVDGLVAAMRRDRDARDAHEHRDLPPDTVLLDEQGWRREVAARPQAAANLHLARCRLLAAARRWGELDATVASVALSSPGDLLPETRILRAEALAGLDRPAEAATALHAIDGSILDEALGQRAAVLAARLWSANAIPH